ncbi:zinc metalloproteinase nas-4 [Eurytemora carolleeae]|uniref:zinc metalloproteinase nas-4 n=1 Tax=Eurytemora carolleeae TaxID=1294199 RepID=UPI000C7778D7|nr:zinc metalloproteinase nas-4 [Eurytemora carolleeae]|eukprot:XP_023325705.1 zinc metalloproteinase nas-4-like [Eurytemora affinis]
MNRLFCLLALISLSSAKISSNDFNINDLVNWETFQLPEKIEAQQGGNDHLLIKDTPGSPINPDDFRASDSVDDESFGIDNHKDPIESAGLFEGDIDNVSMDELHEIGDSARNAIKDGWRKWPDATIPYLISNQFSQYERSVIAKAMKNYHDNTCIRFRPRTSETAYIHIMKGSGCSSSVGRTGSVQSVSLGNGCVYTGIVMHELMHASGFWHEQSRADRDSHIRINWDNIIQGMEYNFLKYDLNKIDHLGAEYDTCSVMHYGAFAFSKARDPTIVPVKEGECQLGQREGFSDTDIRKLNTLYQCSGYPQVGNSVTNPEATTTTVKPWVKPKCEDQNQYCATWAKADECKKNPSWMLVYCPVACDQCKIDCEDNNVYCDDWAAMGECDKNPDYMNIYCAKSCKVCSGGDCMDENKSCSGWAAQGYCTNSKYKEYMSLRCKSSCNKC